MAPPKPPPNPDTLDLPYDKRSDFSAAWRKVICNEDGETAEEGEIEQALMDAFNRWKDVCVLCYLQQKPCKSGKHTITYKTTIKINTILGLHISNIKIIC